MTDVDEQPETPAAPAVWAPAGTTDSLGVSWTAPGRNGGPALTGYKLRYRTGASGTWTEPADTLTGTSATIGSLDLNSAYDVQVQALNGETPSAWSPSGTGTTGTAANAGAEVWSSTLTVGEHTIVAGDSVDFRGYRSDTSTGGLSDDDFDLLGTSFTVSMPCRSSYPPPAMFSVSCSMPTLAPTPPTSPSTWTLLPSLSLMPTLTPIAPDSSSGAATTSPGPTATRSRHGSPSGPPIPSPAPASTTASKSPPPGNSCLPASLPEAPSACSCSPPPPATPPPPTSPTTTPSCRPAPPPATSTSSPTSPTSMPSAAPKTPTPGATRRRPTPTTTRVSRSTGSAATRWPTTTRTSTTRAGIRARSGTSPDRLSASPTATLCGSGPAAMTTAPNTSTAAQCRSPSVIPRPTAKSGGVRRTR